MLSTGLGWPGLHSDINPQPDDACLRVAELLESGHNSCQELYHLVRGRDGESRRATCKNSSLRLIDAGPVMIIIISTGWPSYCSEKGWGESKWTRPYKKAIPQLFFGILPSGPVLPLKRDNNFIMDL